jgi:NAD+ diphosphatase
MAEQPQYIFRSGELFVVHDTTLPGEIPEEFADLVLDSIELPLAGRTARVVLLKDTANRQTVVSASVSNAGSSSGQPPVCPGLAASPGATDVSGRWVRLREIVAASDPRLASLAAPASRALGIINWHNATRFCGRCGAPLSDHEKELARTCAACGSVMYPRISPAIIVVVERGDTILLARHSYRNQDVFSCIAGFLEHGETLEECVAREVREETGIEVHKIRYVGSQSWPYPDQFMIAFRAEWKAGEVSVDPAELLEARWFTRDNLPNTPMKGTVAWNLIHDVFDSQKVTGLC